MRAILHILTRPEDDLTRELIKHQRTLPDVQVEVITLSSNAPDYETVVEKIFAADSIEVF